MLPEQYLALVERVIRQNFRADDQESGGMTAARAGFLARQVIGQDPSVAGFAKFKDVLSELERKDVVKLGSNSKGALAIWLQQPTSTIDCGSAEISDHSEVAAFRRLRNPLWLAFVSESPVGRRLFNKKTGEVRVGQQHVPATVDDWVLINPVDTTGQREEARQFVSAQNLASISDLIEAIDSPNWFHAFPSALKEAYPALAGKWNRLRSNLVINRVEEWRQSHGIDSSLVYEAQPVTDHLAHARSVGRRAFTREEEGARQAILRAIGMMSTEELLGIPIPARYLISVLNPDLLSR